MIHSVPQTDQIQASAGLAKPRPVLKMVSHDRMAGHVPVWEPPQSAREVTLARLDAAASERTFQDVLNDALAYSPATEPENINDVPFGLGDLVDIVNPLQQIPLVGTLYRSITGDDIRPSSLIVGGAIYGGVAGAASGLVNLIIEEETGKSIEGHALAMIEPDAKDETLTRLAQDQPAEPDLSAHVLGFVETSVPKPTPVFKSYRLNE